MRVLVRSGGMVVVVVVLSAWAAAQQPAAQPAGRSADPVVGSYQIDRYDAIEHLRQGLAQHPDNVTDWILLGELAQEVAQDAPADRAPGYYKLARESFDHALQLQPNNPGLQAAARFAREQEQGAEKFTQTRRQNTAGYLAARRRQLTATSNAPLYRTYTAPPSGTGFVATYQPYVSTQGAPTSYQQHYDAFFGPPQPRSPGQGLTETETKALVKPAARAAPP